LVPCGLVVVSAVHDAGNTTITGRASKESAACPSCGLLDGEISLRAGELDPDLFLYADHLTGVQRLTYVRLNRQTVTAFANVIMTEPMHGLPRFQVGVAVPEAYRGKGYAKSIVAAAIAELRHGLARNTAAGEKTRTERDKKGKRMRRNRYADCVS
jgi:hypothetical protein